MGRSTVHCLESLLKSRRRGRGQMQAELGPAKQYVLGCLRPLMFHKVADFALGQVTGDDRAEFAGRQDLPCSGAVGSDQAVEQRRRNAREFGKKLGEKRASASQWKIASRKRRRRRP